MDRWSEVEILAACLEAPVGSVFRAVLVAQKQGRLNAAARVTAEQVEKRPALAWLALLLALEASELKLAGAVAFTTPRVRFAVDGPGFTERWGEIGIKTYTGVTEHRDGFLLTAYPCAKALLEVAGERSMRLTVTDVPANGVKAIAEAISVLRAELGAHLGRVICVEGVPTA